MDPDIQSVLDHTADRLTAVERQMGKIHQTLFWIQILSVIRILIIAIPIILALIYLPAFLEDFQGQLDTWLPLFGV